MVKNGLKWVKILKKRGCNGMEKREGAIRAEGSAVEGYNGYNLRKTVKRVAKWVGMGACAYFAGLAELPFGARPFGVALLAAAGKESAFVYIGLILSAFATLELDEAIIYFAIYSALLLLRIFSWVAVELRDGKMVALGGKNRKNKALYGIFEERVGLRVITASIFGLALGIAILLSGGMLYYDLFGLLMVILTAPLTSFLLCRYLAGRGRRLNQNSREWVGYALGALALFSITVYGAREVNVYGVSVSVALALIITFYVTRRYGVGYGSLGGLFMGLCYSPMLSPIFVISALCAGVLMRFSASLACFAAFFASCAWAFYVQGISALLGVFGGILSACLLYSVIHKAFFADVEDKSNVKQKATANPTQAHIKCRTLQSGALDGIKLYDMNLRTSAISDGLYRLSLLFDELKTNNAYFNSSEFNIGNYNTAFGYDVSAPEYRALSSLLVKAMENKEDDYFVDRELSDRLCGVLTELRLDIYGVLVYGVRKKTVYLKSESREKLTLGAREIFDAIAPLLPFSIDFDTIIIRRDGENRGVMLISEREKNSASVIKRKVNARGEAVCGDSAASFKNKDNRFFALLSDGMGSGRTASAISEIAVGFFANMLNVGALDEDLVDMINSFLCARFQKNITECSATLDLFELDLMNGRAKFYKCGAAPSYIYRRGRLFKLRSESMPIGILDDVDLKKYELELSRGDVVVMVSDGVTGEGGECPWLFDLLAQNLPNRGLERTADLIVKYATAKGSGDDITVMIVKVD